ncbi:ATP-binding cassette domain-containing protein [Paenibacillus sp. FSL K6-2441]|uniref:ATP-binding cassette domain-containing protein n=1 Tax=Paenibacillus sp. FSL K6-2441 TaxID=2954679 RepID=UPI0030DDBBF2
MNIHQAGYESGMAAIKQISLEVKPGVLTGLIGLNGAGKSTTLKAILGLLPFADAEVTLHGGANHYAYIPEQPVFYDTLTLWEHLGLAARSKTSMTTMASKASTGVLLARWLGGFSREMGLSFRRWRS